MSGRDQASTRSSEARATAPRRVETRLMMAMTADGKIASIAREAARFGSREDQRRLQEQVAWADALVIGAGTVRAYGTTFRVTRADLVRARTRRGQNDQPVSVVISRSLDLPRDIPFFTRQRVPRLIVTTNQKEQAARERFGDMADILAAGECTIDPAAVFDELAGRGLRRVLALGGGRLNFALLQARLVDELLLTISPRVFGGGSAPTVADGEGFDLRRAPALELIACEPVGDEVFLRYRVRRAARARPGATTLDRRSEAAYL